MPASDSIYATPRAVTDLQDCHFYHTMEIPDYGRVEGEWDLRGGVREYLGNVEFKCKRVLELGTASGFLCFHMEHQGAEVVAYDLSEEQSWDVVSFARWDGKEFASTWKEHVRKVNNAYWLCHRAYNAVARVVYGTIYAIPAEIGAVDISTFGCILLHVRDPFLALQQALRLTRETVIITEVAGEQKPFQKQKPSMVFLPDFKTCEPKTTWWLLTPDIIQSFIGALGFEKSEVSYHHQLYAGHKQLLYTVVGHRTTALSERGAR